MKSPLLWIIDDTERWHRVAAASAKEAGWRIECYLDHEVALARAAATMYEKPQVVLMDFFLSGAHGDTVTQQLKPLLSAATIIGHSSVPACSRRIVAAGADLILPKWSDQHGVNPDLVTFLTQWNEAE